MWIPEAAVKLIDLRRFTGAVPELERLAAEGKPNGDSAAMRCLIRMGTREARGAVQRLSETVVGQKSKMLEMLRRGPLRPPRWE
jgi:hypothetical protein